MKHIVTICVAAVALCSCVPNNMPTIAVDQTTGKATVTPSASGKSDPFLAFTVNDQATAINLACGNPPADPVACNFMNDIVNVINALPKAPDITGTTGVLTLAEQARLGLVAATGGNLTQLKGKLLGDGYIYVADTKAKGLQVASDIMDLIKQVAGQALVP